MGGMAQSEGSAPKDPTSKARAGGPYGVRVVGREPVHGPTAGRSESLYRAHWVPRVWPGNAVWQGGLLHAPSGLAMAMAIEVEMEMEMADPSGARELIEPC
jgi:hypothetical protein